MTNNPFNNWGPQTWPMPNPFGNYGPQTWPVPNMTAQQLQTITELGQMLQQGKNPLEELKVAQEKLAAYEKRNTVDLTSQLSNTAKGQQFLDLRKDGIIEILINNALRNPETQKEMQAFLDNWTAKANEYLKGMNDERS